MWNLEKTPAAVVSTVMTEKDGRTLMREKPREEKRKHFLTSASTTCMNMTKQKRKKWKRRVTVELKML